ncbi:prolyl oligopeptidase family serine peptidase [Agromyces sp. CFH 90414]|uniref:Prolyl oligopeptidase family serine peptidase n=1 Tax=Agromyces agglutinans TaxID=2662258 RepID=A0A6I2F301_9MICO|nr:acetylxylan esterase [Agromyces agglutinans]MRG59915.1 prolyl oligopeptidase family serine peptidase [Agromyces agglutinans]
MPRFDLSPAELREYRPEVAEPADFDAFWARTLAESRAVGQAPELTRVESPLALVDVYDLAFSGFAGDVVRAWAVVPAGTTEPLPTVVEFNGYNGGRGLPHERLAWAASGYAWVFMDTRGQGSGWGTGGSTPDPHGTGPSVAGFMTRGILDPEQYYYRRVFTDAALLVDAVRELEFVDAARVAVTGTSQGGGIAFAAAGLSEGLVAVMPDVPFLCHFERAVGLTDRDPYHEVERYLAVHRGDAEQVFRTLSYFDGVNHARRATAPALVSVALMDPVCPPSTVYAAANHYGGEASVVEYAFNEHEGGQGVHWERQAAWLADLV